MNYILKGDPKEVAKVLQENRIRVDRGVIEFTPCQQDMAIDEDCIKNLRESHKTLSEERQRLAVEQHELAELTGLVVSIAVEGGQTIPDEITARLAKFGVIVPKIAEIVPYAAGIADDASESVPNNSETVEDDKAVDAGDMTEVNLDDVKDTEEADTKDAPAPTPKKRRYKTS